ncbi:MAG: hypothetical protein GY865_07465 [candidate division Zixibacteria bacterium]|nr:hypothetical protein [candidate division Zixibacteria bacterium]
MFPISAYCSDSGQSKKDIISIRAGFWGPTYLSFDQKRYDLESSFSCGINIERARENRFYTGLAIDIFRFHAKYKDEEVSLINFGFVAKRNYPLKKAGLSIRPSLTVGLALKSEFSFVEKSGHITIKAAVDVISNVDKPVSFLIEGGFFWAVAGMENKTKIYSSPAPVLRAGVMF